MDSNLTPSFRSRVWDGHYHAFSHRGINSIGFPDKLRVGFADIELDCLDQYEDIPGLYSKYMSKCKNIVWLATGLTIDDVKAIYNDHPNEIVGFGELKLYDEFKCKPVNFKKISFARQVCKFSDELGGLPVYIHYELDEPINVRAFAKLLSDFPNVPIVLCHCGMSEKNTEYAFGAAKMLAANYGNCWLDLSWDAAKHLSRNPMLVTQLPQDRIFLGSDTSPRLEAHGFKSASLNEIDGWLAKLNDYVNSDRNIRNLFNGRKILRT